MIGKQAQQPVVTQESNILGLQELRMSYEGVLLLRELPVALRHEFEGDDNDLVLDGAFGDDWSHRTPGVPLDERARLLRCCESDYVDSAHEVVSAGDCCHRRASSLMGERS